MEQSVRKNFRLKDLRNIWKNHIVKSPNFEKDGIAVFENFEFWVK